MPAVHEDGEVYKRRPPQIKHGIQCRSDGTTGKENIIAKNDLLDTALTEWIGSLTSELSAEHGFGYRFVA